MEAELSLLLYSRFDSCMIKVSNQSLVSLGLLWGCNKLSVDKQDTRLQANAETNSHDIEITRKGR